LGEGSGDGDGDEDEDQRPMRDARVEQNNDIPSRFLNLLKYILVIRCGGAAVRVESS
jgi:hypothetical protein